MKRAAVAVAVVVVAVIAVVALVAARGQRPRAHGKVKLQVAVAPGPQRLPADPDGLVRVFAPEERVSFHVEVCGGGDLPVALWTSAGRDGAWRALDGEIAWQGADGCRVADVTREARVLWPDVPRGVGRWTWVVAPDADVLSDPPEAAWGRAPARVDGEVVLRARPTATPAPG